MSKHKEKASVLWLISKACKNEIPDDLREPYYRDHRDALVLKPQITQGLASCELYSLALSYIYEDPQYASLNHTGVIQLLMRKGVSLVESHVTALTETVLIQNAPIRMNAHMIVIEAIMALYIKDILIADQVIEVVSRYFPIDSSDDLPLTIEETALFWINKSALRLKQLADEEMARFEHESLPQHNPIVNEAQELAELGSGNLLLALISFYCPAYINWTEICLKEQLTMEECMANLELLQYFCAKYLPYDICFLDIEDFLQLQNSMKINLLTFIADLMYLFEIKPAACVRRILSEDDNHHHQSIIDQSDEDLKETPTQMRASRSSSRLFSASEMKAKSLRHTSWQELESDELNDPKLYQQQKLAKYFQPHQHLRQEIHRPLARSESTASTLHSKQRANGINELVHGLGSMRMDSGSTADSFYLSHDVNSNHVHNGSNDHNNSINTSTTVAAATASPISFAKLSQAEHNNHNHSHHNNSNTITKPAISVAYSSNQQSSHDLDSNMPTETDLGGQIMEIRLKLEEKRRQIEMGRRQQEDNWKTQRQGIGKEAFLKALKKEKLNCSGSNSLLYTTNTSISSSSAIKKNHDSMDVCESKENLSQFFLHSDNLDNVEEDDLSSKRLSDYIRKDHQPTKQESHEHEHEEHQENEDHPTNKGFFILFDDDNEKKKPKSMPPSLRSRIRAKNESKAAACDEISVSQITAVTDDSQQQQIKSIGFVIGPEPDPMSELEKAKKKEAIVIQSLKRRAEQETQRIIKEDELSKKRDLERKKRESAEKRKEESRLRREAILEQYRRRKMQDETPTADGKSDLKATLRNRPGGLHRGSRPKSIHVSTNVVQQSASSDQSALLESLRSTHLVSDHLDAAMISYPISSRYSTLGSSRPQSSLSTNSAALKKLSASAKTTNLSSLSSFLISHKKGSGSSDGVSEIGSTCSEYTGPKLYVKPAQKSNRGIIINAINSVLGGAVNCQLKKKVLEEINNNDSKNFLILFRGTGVQFRAIYSYNPDIEEIVKLHGTGPKVVNNEMIDKFYKYNSGAKNFNEVHTKHLTVTIDAFTIHSFLWNGKRVPPPPKKDSY